MKLDEVQRRVREANAVIYVGEHRLERLLLYHDTLRTLLDHDLPDDARQIIEAALEAER